MSETVRSLTKEHIKKVEAVFASQKEDYEKLQELRVLTNELAKQARELQASESA